MASPISSILNSDMIRPVIGYQPGCTLDVDYIMLLNVFIFDVCIIVLMCWQPLKNEERISDEISDYEAYALNRVIETSTLIDVDGIKIFIKLMTGIT